MMAVAHDGDIILAVERIREVSEEEVRESERERVDLLLRH